MILWQLRVEIMHIINVKEKSVEIRTTANVLKVILLYYYFSLSI